MIGVPIDAFTEKWTPDLRRLQVDDARTGFYAGREFRLFKEFVVGATPLVFRVTIPTEL